MASLQASTPACAKQRAESRLSVAAAGAVASLDPGAKDTSKNADAKHLRKTSIFPFSLIRMHDVIAQSP
jgi:hypothetical protein